MRQQFIKDFLADDSTKRKEKESKIQQKLDTLYREVSDLKLM